MSFINIDRTPYFTQRHKLMSAHYTAKWLYWERNNFILNYAGNLMKQSHKYIRSHNKHPQKQICDSSNRSDWYCSMIMAIKIVFLKCLLKCQHTVCRCQAWSNYCVSTILVSCYLHNYFLMKMYTMTVWGSSFYTPARLCTEQTYRLPNTHLSLKLIVQLHKTLLAQQFLPECDFSSMLGMFQTFPATL